MPGLFYNSSSRPPFKNYYSVSRLPLLFLPSFLIRERFIMGLEKDSNFLHLAFNADDQGDIYHPIFPAMPSQEQESNFGALHLDNGPWITQNMDIAQPLLRGAHSSSATQSSQLESALSSHSQTVATSSRVKIPLPPIRQRTAQACDKCRERKTKVRASYSGIYMKGYRRYCVVVLGTSPCLFPVYEPRPCMRIFFSRDTITYSIEVPSWLYSRS